MTTSAIFDKTEKCMFKYKRRTIVKLVSKIDLKICDQRYQIRNEKYKIFSDFDLDYIFIPEKDYVR